MKILAWCVLLPALFFAGLASAEEELQLEHGQFACIPEKGLCVVRQDDLASATKAMTEARRLLDAQAEVIERNARELKTLRDSKGCAKVTVQRNVRL